MERGSERERDGERESRVSWPEELLNESLSDTFILDSMCELKHGRGRDREEKDREREEKDREREREKERERKRTRYIVFTMKKEHTEG